MEKKSTKYNDYSSLLLYSLKNKRNWAILSTAIILVTTLLVPYLLNADGEFFILFGIVETFILVFLNCLIDNNLLHNESKLGYYKSKPVTLRRQIFISLIVNVIYTGFLLALIALSVYFQGLDYEILRIFKLIIPWLLAGIFLASLSSILSGNTIMAGAMTIFNFFLPWIIYLIVLFIFTILENAVIGFSADVLMDYLTNTIYKIDRIYFMNYADNTIDVMYFITLAIILIFISFLINKFIKRRKNENTGNYIAFDGFKYFVSVLACLIAPAAFSIMSYSNSMISKIIVSLILAILTYYIIIALMEKSFRISILSVKVFILSIIVFSGIAGGTVIFANQYKDFVPAVEDVKLAYVGTNSYTVKRMMYDTNNPYDIDSNEGLTELAKNHGIVLFEEKENIKNITDMHKEILEDQNYKFSESYYYSSLVITYWMNDGKVIVRDYNLNRIEDTLEYNENKDLIANKIINSQELKRRKYFYLYDEEAYNSANLISYISSDFTGEVIKHVDVDEIRPYLIKDIEKNYAEVENPFHSLLVYNFDLHHDKAIGTNEYFISFEEITNNQNYNNTYRIYLDKEFESTLEYLDIK